VWRPIWWHSRRRRRKPFVVSRMTAPRIPVARRAIAHPLGVE
jgi:hypothetical protein